MLNSQTIVFKMRDFVIEATILLISAVYGSPTTVETTTLSPEDIGNILPICSRKDPKLDECIQNATVILREKIVDGFPELSIPSLNPFNVPTIKVQQQTKAMKYKAVLMDVKLYGLADYEFFDIKSDIEKLTLNMSALFDHVYIDTEYMLMGSYEGLPIDGSGRMMANFSQSIAQINLLGAILSRDNVEYFVNKDVDVSINLGDAVIDFENLYTGGSMESKITDHIIKMHADDLLKQLKPAIENVMSIIVDDITTKFFKSLSYDRLMPE